MVIVKNSQSFLLCYASQKGNAQAIAEDIFDQCTKIDLTVHLSCMSKIISIEELRHYSYAIFVGSTTGDGDPPDTAHKFIGELKKQISAKQQLLWLNYTILGLGDTNYTNFCNFGKTLHGLLQNLGCKSFYDAAWADDGIGLELVVEPWIEGLFPVLKSLTHSQILNVEKNICDKTFLNSESLLNEGELNAIHFRDFSDFSENLLSDLNMEVELNKLFPLLNLPCQKDIKEHSVKKLKFPLDFNLTLPIVPSKYLILTFGEPSDNQIENNIGLSQDNSYPLATSNVFSCNIKKCRQLTKLGSLKKALEVSIDINTTEAIIYEPGDTFGLIVQNSDIETDLILHLLNLEDKADIPFELSIDPNTNKKGAKIPPYIINTSSLRYIFTNYLDFRSIPKKPFLRALVEYTKDDMESRRLSELVSKEGAEEYNKIVRLHGLTVLDLLILFQTCRPPISLVLEHLPRLLPRPYSITSSPLVDPQTITFAFNVIDIPQENSITFARKGICTGFLDQLTFHLQDGQESSIEDRLQALSLNKNLDSKIPIYFRSNQNFRLPKDINIPIIMIGPGTGVAPFIGFLQHRQCQIMNRKNNDEVGNAYLFFGCRHKDKDFLYQKELELFLNSGVLEKLFVCFSRDEGEGSPKYVQDNLVANGEMIADLINEKNAHVYVCGDAKNMSRNVFDTFNLILGKHLKLNDIDGRKYLAQMQISNRYLQDVWS